MSEAKFVRAPVGVLSFPRFSEKQYNDSDTEKKNGKYSLNVVFPAKADLGPIKKLVQKAALDKFGEKAKAMKEAGKLKLPIRSGSSFCNDEGELYDGYEEDSQVLVISFYHAMAFFDQFKNKIKSDSDQANDSFYPGCKVQVAVTAHGFSNESKGVQLRLYALMKRDEGERIGGGGVGDPDEIFDDVESADPKFDGNDSGGSEGGGDGDDW